MAKPKMSGSGKRKPGKPKPEKNKPKASAAGAGTGEHGHAAGGYCWNCGQTAVGDTFALSLTQTAAFCCRCGTRLAENGTCRLPACPFFERRPQC
jgi:hypothetical protein